jgi:hypothetical protein
MAIYGRTVDASNINDLAICCHNAYATSSKLCFLVVLDGERLSAGKRCRRGLDNIHLDLDELPDFALHINELRCFSPAAIKQTVGRHDARRCGRFWFNHNTHKRIKRLMRILAR